jgi:hypothetical protein
MKICGGVVTAPPFLTTGLNGEWSASCPFCFTPEARSSGTHEIGDWLGPRVGLDAVKKRDLLPLQGLESHFLAHPSSRYTN